MSLVEFICGCPVEGCPNGRTQLRWVHCGGNETLSDTGYLTCKRCGTTGPMVNWTFNCGAHDYKSASLQGLLNAFSIMGNVQGISHLFLLNLMDAVRRQYS